MSNSLHQPLYGLALHATSPQLGLLLGEVEGTFRHQTWELGRKLSTDLHHCLIEFIKPQQWSDLSFIAVAKGPGSFTSTRIGLVAARTLAQQLEIPLFAISTLAAFAKYKQRADSLDPKKNLAVQMQARREQLFVAIYQLTAQGTLKVLLADTTLTPEIWQEKLEQLDCSYHLIEAPENLGETVTGVFDLAVLEWQVGKRNHWSEALPFYGMHPVN
ncbi:tRNA (adenosine(37)-N6)-threonylcarbamoyltransferase complex dimerization subunit type 1 TsaB [Lusitaniella coriacea]|uniref:tRNA (adenosine(37)-N6)-threonylcarbamoyltransferase complex dimerization subunit type 1 TsaB n=1 Tax=Lusitaniella coriacea TaxID=1983105 RepID=UPI003CF6716D